MMATHTASTGPSFSSLSLAAPSYSQSNPIDLTLEDDDEGPMYQNAKRQRRQHSQSANDHRDNLPWLPLSNPGPQHPPQLNPVLPPLPPLMSSHNSHSDSFPESYRPVFAGPSSPAAFYLPQPRASSYPASSPPVTHRLAPTQSDPQIIDLTGSPSPPPSLSHTPTGLPTDLPPKTPVCIGQLTVTALVLYPVSYLQHDSGNEPEWAAVRLQYEHNPNKPGGSETIHIKAPNLRGPSGEVIAGDEFGVVEQKVATSIGPMLGKGLIRLDGKVRKGMPNLPILPLQMLVYTPKGNIPVVGNYLHQSGLLLDHPSPPYDVQRLASYHYFNPHNPPPGGHSRALFAANRIGGFGGQVGSRWSTPTISGKSVEVQRSQVDELFKSLKSGDELVETEPTSDVATPLYPHQKKAITFLLERERERTGPDGKFSSLWQERRNPMSGHTSWLHIVTQKEAFHEPPPCKGAILADDMGLGKTITCVALIAATLDSARSFALEPLAPLAPPPDHHGNGEPSLTASHFSGSIWGMPEVSDAPPPTSLKAKAKAARVQDKIDAEYTRASRIKAKSRATLIICPLSTVSNWEDQFREHWQGDVTVVGGAGGMSCATAVSQSSICRAGTPASSHSSSLSADVPEVKSGTSLRVYVYHGNARRPDPAFLADFDAVITTYATLASEFSRQSRSIAMAEADDEGDEGSSDGGGIDVDERGNPVIRLPKSKKTGLKRKLGTSVVEASSALQSIHWFRVVLDEAHSIKETSTVGSRASCDLKADRRLCLTGTPVQNKLDDVFALIKFLRLEPFDDKNIWTEFIGTPVKYGQALGFARIQTIMKCITLRRTKESKTPDGQKILALPPRRDELRYLKFDEQEQGIYDQFFTESKAEFNELSDKNEVMKNYVGILQKILRLRQICDHFELVQGKGPGEDGQSQDPATLYEDTVAAIAREGINAGRASTIFALLRESATTQCVECGMELCNPADPGQTDGSILDCEGPSTSKRVRKGKGTTSRGPTRASSPSMPHPVLTRCQHLFCLECYQNCICPGWPKVLPDTQRSCSACQTGLSPNDAVEVSPDCTLESTTKKKPVKKEKRQKGLSLDNFHPSTKVKALLGDLVPFSRANPYSANYTPDSIEVQMVDDQGNGIDDSIIKTVVFSQWTSMLDKVEDALEVACIRYDRLDGTMKRDDRTRAMDALKYDPGCEVLLVSLKAGGVGLNLTAAQRVYLMDPYWNPAVENQAVDRIHRLGQSRPVTTVKLIIENSIEARLLEVQRKKTELANMTLGQNFSKAEMLQRRMDELSQLFGS